MNPFRALNQEEEWQKGLGMLPLYVPRLKIEVYYDQAQMMAALEEATRIFFDTEWVQPTSNKGAKPSPPLSKDISPPSVIQLSDGYIGGIFQVTGISVGSDIHGAFNRIFSGQTIKIGAGVASKARYGEMLSLMTSSVDDLGKLKNWGIAPSNVIDLAFLAAYHDRFWMQSHAYFSKSIMSPKAYTRKIARLKDVNAYTWFNFAGQERAVPNCMQTSGLCQGVQLTKMVARYVSCDLGSQNPAALDWEENPLGENAFRYACADINGIVDVFNALEDLVAAQWSPTRSLYEPFEITLSEKIRTARQSYELIADGAASRDLPATAPSNLSIRSAQSSFPRSQAVAIAALTLCAAAVPTSMPTIPPTAVSLPSLSAALPIEPIDDMADEFWGLCELHLGSLQISPEERRNFFQSVKHLFDKQVDVAAPVL